MHWHPLFSLLSVEESRLCREKCDVWQESTHTEDFDNRREKGEYGGKRGVRAKVYIMAVK